MDPLSLSTTSWLEKLFSYDVFLVNRLEYFPLKNEFVLEFSNPENSDSTLSILFTKVEAFEDAIHDRKEFDQSAEGDLTDDPIDFKEHRKEGITEYVLCTTLREIHWQTNEPPIIRGSKGQIDKSPSGRQHASKNEFEGCDY